MGIAAAIAGAAVIGTVGTVVASSQAAGAAKSAANANNKLEASIYAQNSSNAQPYIGAGKDATAGLEGILGIGGDPAASKTALNNYLSSAGYGFVSTQGNRAITANQSVNGLLDSGGTLKALDTYNTGLASTYLGQYEGALSGVAQTGEAASSGLAGAGTAYGQAVSANNNSAASAEGNAALSGAASINQLLSSAIGAYGLNKGLSSYATPSASTSNGLTGLAGLY